MSDLTPEALRAHAEQWAADRQRLEAAEGIKTLAAALIAHARCTTVALGEGESCLDAAWRDLDAALAREEKP